MWLVAADQTRFALQAHVDAEPLGQDVAELMPPSRLVGVLGTGEEVLDLCLLGPVRLHQLLGVDEPEADLPPLHPADGLPVDGTDRLGLLPGQPGSLPQFLEPLAEHHP